MNEFIESPSGAAWRDAAEEGLTLDEFVRYEFGFDWNRAHQNLDEVFAAAENHRRPRILAAVGSYRCVPLHWHRSTWDRSRKAHVSTVYFCPDCMRTGDGEVDLRWQLKFSCVCVRHGRLLVGACPSCGEANRYRKGPGAGVHWLDHWRFCSACGLEVESSPIAPAWLRETTRALEGFLLADNRLQACCQRFTELFARAPSTLFAFQSSLVGFGGVDGKALAANALLFATIASGGAVKPRQTLESFALLGVDSEMTVGQILAEVVNLSR